MSSPFQRTWLIASIVSVSAAAGCSGTAIRPGVWELTIDLERIENGAKFDTIQKKVNVLVWPVPEQRKKNEWHVEEAELRPLSSESSVQAVAKDPTRVGRKPMYADIYRREEATPTIEVNTMRDESWTFHMLGTVKDDKTVVGNMITGRPRYPVETPANFQGKWTMKWLADEP